MVGAGPHPADVPLRALVSKEMMISSRPGEARGRRRKGYLLALAPLALVMAVLFAVPIVRTLMRSVLEPDVGFENFAKVLADPLTQQVFWTTLRITVGVTL